MARTPKKLGQVHLGEYTTNTMDSAARANTTTSDYYTYTVVNASQLPILDVEHLTVYIDGEAYTLTGNDSVNLTTGSVTFETALTTETVQLNYSWIESTKTTLYTAPSGKATQVVQMWITNVNDTYDRNITFYAHGTDDVNILIKRVPVVANGTVRIDDMKVILSGDEAISAIQDSNTEDVIITIYGIEEI